MIPEEYIVPILGLVSAVAVSFITGWLGFKTAQKKTDSEMETSISSNVHKAEEGLRTFLTGQLQEMEKKYHNCESERMKDQSKISDIMKKNLDLDFRVHQLKVALQKHGIHINGEY